jgi:hypothetical protein
MAREKKTIEVEMVKDYANKQLANENLTMEEKLGIITMIEEILHRSNAYRGYMYLSLPNGEAPGLGTDEWVSRKYF